MLKLKNWNYVIMLILVTLLIYSCEKSPDEKFKTINDFNKKFVDSLIPDNSDYHLYTTYYIHIKGYADDSIRIKPGKEEDEYFYIYLKDSINQELKMDYYGSKTRYILFDPYKAKNGKIEISYKLM